MEPTSLFQLRKGCYDTHARIGDMDANGIAASLNFGTLAGFDGWVFAAAPDRTHAIQHAQAYNDWHIHEWCAPYPGRFIANGLSCRLGHRRVGGRDQAPGWPGLQRDLVQREPDQARTPQHSQRILGTGVEGLRRP